MTIRELRAESKMTQRAFAKYLNIPVKTIESWDAGTREPSDYVVELIEYKLRKEVAHMKDFAGIRWGCLTEKEKEHLLSEASPIDGRTGSKPKKSMECIIDLAYPYSVSGYYQIGECEDEIIIDDDAVIYVSNE